MEEEIQRGKSAEDPGKIKGGPGVRGRGGVREGEMDREIEMKVGRRRDGEKRGEAQTK